MISANDVSLSFGGQKLFEDVNIKFVEGNCYGLIGANGAGKSTFLKILSGEIETQSGSIFLTPGQRLSILNQDHFAFDEHTVLNTVVMGNKLLYDIMVAKDAIYAKEDFSDEDGLKAAELEAEFSEMNGWEAESEAAIMLSALDIKDDIHQTLMKDIAGELKVKVLLAQALFGSPDILLLDEPTNHLDIKAIRWLENFLLEFKNTVIVVSHDRHFLNKVCTNIADIDFGKVRSYSGNYDFWKKSSDLMMQLKANESKKATEKAEELKKFIQRFSANASKSKQATSRQKQLDKLEIGDLPVSSRRSPFVKFTQTREAGNDILKVDSLTKTIDGQKVLNNVSFTLKKGDKVAFLSDNDIAITTLFKIITGKLEADSGKIELGVTITLGDFPADNSEFFQSNKLNLVDWLRQYSEDQDISFIRGFLGKMLFTGDGVNKKVNVLSGGEKVRCMLSKIMLTKPNLLILDGPTDHLDLESITAVNDGLVSFRGSALLSTHDHQLMQTSCNRIIEINQSVVFDEYTSYEGYLEH